jgi:hypothetical protein
MNIITSGGGQIIINKLKIMIEQRKELPDFQKEELETLEKILQWIEELSYLKDELLKDVKDLFEYKEKMRIDWLPSYNKLFE